MKNINYNGSIAEDVQFLKRGSKKAALTSLAGVAGFIGTGFLPVTVPVIVAGAAFVGFGAMAVGGAVKAIHNDFVKKPKAEKRLYKLLDLMGVSKDVNEHDIKVASEVPMKVIRARKVKSTTGNYVIVNDKKKQQIIREVKSDDLKAYKQFLLDLNNTQEANLCANELSCVDDVVVLRKR